MAHSRGDTRARILHTAAELFQRQGYGATGLNQVLTASGAPKGSLYFHFPDGKEQLAAEAMALAGAEMGGADGRGRSRDPGPAEAIAASGALLAQALEDSDYRDGCPIATVALEEAGTPVRSTTPANGHTRALAVGDRRMVPGLGPGRAGGAGACRPGDVLLQGALLLARVRRDSCRHPYGRPPSRSDRRAGSE